MKMTTSVLLVGTLLIFIIIFVIVVIIPTYQAQITPSDIVRKRTQIEEEGRKIYIENGCTYCHSQYIRPQDWDLGADRIAQEGDYVNDEPILLGSIRTGPDLSNAGGEHPDDWHYAHFVNPRYTRPESIMPPFEFLGDKKIRALTSYIQSLGGKEADARVARQKYWNKILVDAYNKGPDSNVAILHRNVPEMWINMPNPYPATEASLKRGERIYQSFCIGCHGPVGDGQGPAAKYLNPPPLNFTLLKRTGASSGIFYYQIMNGITGTAMPYFKRELESEKIWDVSNYIMINFVGKKDANLEPRGIDASYEPVDSIEIKKYKGE
ncbi:MAG: Cytochrome C oxidase, cbb3-type, subunit II (CcoO) [Ignavibacteriae bacterium]|nr:MAG: Cytochrome C oxidase, cbb3-type, subunit II (CcoO) [Ignavibacteriota bacterium]